MSTAQRILLQGLVLATLVCVGLSGHPQALGGAPLQSTSIQSGSGPDSQCIVVRRTLSSDASESIDGRPSLAGLPTSQLVVLPAAWRLVPACLPVDSSVPSRLVIDRPRERAPPIGTIA